MESLVLQVRQVLLISGGEAWGEATCECSYLPKLRRSLFQRRIPYWPPRQMRTLPLPVSRRESRDVEVVTDIWLRMVRNISEKEISGGPGIRGGDQE